MSDENRPTEYYEDQPAHHPDGPSSLALSELCAAYEKGTDEETEHRGAVEGTVLHMILETGTIPDGFVYTEEHRILIDNTLRLKEEIMKGADEELREVRLDVGQQPDGSYLTFGTTDVLGLFRKSRHAEVIDYKMGLLPIEPAKTNIQGWCYTLGVFEKYDWVETVSMTFLALRQHDEPITYTFTRDDIPKMRTRIRTIIQRKREGFITPHPSACEFCAKAARCQPLWEQLRPLAAKWALEADHFTAAQEIDASNLEVIFKRNPNKVALTLRMLDVLHKFRDEVRDYVKDQILKGADVPGYDVYTKRRPTKQDFSRDRDVLALLLEEFQVDPIDIMLRIGPLRRSVCEGAISDVTDHGQKKHEVTRFRQRVQELGLWYDPSGNPEAMSYVLRAKKAHQYTGVGLPVSDRRKFLETKKPVKVQQQILSPDGPTELVPSSKPKTQKHKNTKTKK